MEPEKALASDELSAYFQPIYRMGDGALFGLEVLARRVVDGEHQPPAQFFHLLHDPKGWLRVDLSGLRHALRIAQILPQQPGRHLFVNLSVATARDPGWLALYLSMLERTVRQVRPHQLVVEIPEKYEGAPLQTAELCFQLRQTGVLVALDDHRGVAADARREGSWLWDIIKIDTGSRHAGDAVDTLRTILARRRAAHLQQPLIILEGIEDVRQVQRFAAYGEPLLIQGYAYSRPLPLEQVLKIVATGDTADIAPAS